jgi:hypothetical protein
MRKASAFVSGLNYLKSSCEPALMFECFCLLIGKLNYLLIKRDAIVYETFVKINYLWIYFQMALNYYRSFAPVIPIIIDN